MSKQRTLRFVQTFVGISSCGRVIYVGVKDRADFDRIELPCEDLGENENGHVLIKTAGGLKTGEAYVIFQHWITSTSLTPPAGSTLVAGMLALATLVSSGAIAINTVPLV